MVREKRRVDEDERIDIGVGQAAVGKAADAQDTPPMLPGSSPTGRVAKMPAGVEKEPFAATLSKKSFLVPVIERLAMASVTDPIALACRS
jgi:hypothetical protein